MNDIKRCSKCVKSSLKNNFHKKPRSKDGLTPHCKPCGKNYKKNIIMNIMI